MATLSEVIKELLSKYPHRYKLSLNFDQYGICIRSNRKKLINLLADYYGDFVDHSSSIKVNLYALEGEGPVLMKPFIKKQPDPGKKRIKEAFFDDPDGRVVRKVLTDMLFIFNKDFHVAIGPCIENVNQIINFINNRYIYWRLQQDCLLLHAAGIDYRGKGLVLAGFSGRGKSTLALHMMSKPVNFVSNDRILVKKDKKRLLMYGLPKMPRINPGTALNNPSLRVLLTRTDYQKYSKMTRDDLWQIEDKYDVMIRDVYGPKRFVLQSRMKLLVILNWKNNQKGFTIQKVDIGQRKDLLGVVRKDPGLFYYPITDDERKQATSSVNYINLLSLCDVYEIKGGVDFQKATDICFQLLQSK